MPNTSAHTAVIPNGTIVLYDDIPLDSEYTHSINRYASGTTELSELLQNYPHKTLTNQSYSRLTENSVRVGLSKEQLIHCNYMLIRNGSYYVNGNNNSLTQGENKIYYAFVTDVEYVNNVTSDVYFTIDYLQTYWHNFIIPPNFIEREHCLVNDDVVGKNLIQESFELGDYLVNNFYHKNYATDLKYNVIMYIPNINNNEPTSVIYDNTTQTVRQGITTADQILPSIRVGYGDVPLCLAIPATVGNHILSKAVELMLSLNNKIVDIVQISGEMYIDNFTSGAPIRRTLTFDEIGSFKRIDNTTYTPRNKKLLNSPFRKLIVTNNNGQNAEYNWELFDTRYNGVSRANFANYNALLPAPMAITHPLYYRGKVEDYENSVILDDFPKINWSEDSFTKWWAQNKANFGLSLATQAISTAGMFAASVATGGGAGVAMQAADLGANALRHMANARLQGNNALADKYHYTAFQNFNRERFPQEDKGNYRGALTLGLGAQGIARTLGQITTAKATPDNATIQKNSALLNVLTGHFGFTFYDMAITGEKAEIIDNYFDMYGYATHKVKVPNFVSLERRPIWNYVKMQNAFIKSQTNEFYNGLPETAQKVIQNIFNNGITLWNNISQIGDYSLANINR